LPSSTGNGTRSTKRRCVPDLDKAGRMSQRKIITRTIGGGRDGPGEEAPSPVADRAGPPIHDTTSTRQRRLCGARRRQQPGTCERPAGWGTPHAGTGRCKLHGGNSPQSIRGAQQRAAQTAAVAFGLPRDVDALTALDEELKRTAGAVEWLTEFIRAQDPAALAWGVAEKVKRGSGEFPGTDVKLAAAPSVWVQLWQGERKHLVDIGKTIVSLGLDERLVRMGEAQGAAVYAVLGRVSALVLEQLGMSDEQRALAVELLPRVLAEEIAGLTERPKPARVRRRAIEGEVVEP
jgi:hypothetical protein